MQGKRFTITVETPDGKMPPAQVQIPDMPMTLGDIVPPVHQLADGVVRLAHEREQREGREIKCGPGCGACCCQLVPMSIPEIVFIADLLARIPAEQANAVRSAFSELKQRLADSGMLARFDKLNVSREDTAVAKDYFFLRNPCPFLINQSCSIHGVRPIACREYNVTSDPQLCVDPFANTISRVKMHRKMTTALAKLAAELLDIPATLVPMPLMFDWYAEYESLVKTEWNGVELFEKTITYALNS